MEIITRWRASRDLERRDEAETESSVAFKRILECGSWRKIRRIQTPRHRWTNRGPRATPMAAIANAVAIRDGQERHSGFSDLFLAASVENRARGQLSK
jgi:hypothetical protein